MKPAVTDHVEIKKYDHPTGGWGSLSSLIRKAYGEGLLMSGIWSTLLKQNKADGYMCVSCSWAKPAEPRPFEFCENGAKATLWDQTKLRCGPDFFARHSVTELLDWPDCELEKQGRLTDPLRYNAVTDRYEPVSWNEAFAEIGMELRRLDPKSVVFYTSGRASLEASFMYQLFARIYGSSNLPDSSNMCHESTSVGLPRSIGSPVGTVQLEDFSQCDMMFFFGHNTGVTAPRLLHPLQEARERNVPVFTFNPLPERGLKRFKNPQNPVDMLSPGPGTKMSSDFFQVRGGGDIAAMTGIAKAVLALDDAAREQGSSRILDIGFIAEHTHGFAEFEAYLRAAAWDDIVARSGIARPDLEHVAEVYSRSNAVIGNYGMGLTQHRHGTENVQMLCNLLLMRGNMGKPGAGISPLRGHSNVQGQRTVGISEKPELVPLDKFAEFYAFEPPREKGLDTVETCEGVIAGSVKGFVGLGGNFVRAVPETGLVEKAWRRLGLHVEIATKLNRSHLLPGAVTYLLPCLSRLERDRQASGDQTVSMEDSTACIHGSFGSRPPVSPNLLSEPKIVAELAKATVPDMSSIPWDKWIADYSRIRDEIERCFPQHFRQFNKRFLTPGGFHRDIKASKRIWETPNKKANFKPPTTLETDPDIDVSGQKVLTLITVRSNDQFNTTVYGYDDRLRGIHGTRMVLLMNEADIQRFGLTAGQQIDLETHADDGVERRVRGLRVTPYSVPQGNCAGYYPELNPLVPLWHRAKEAHVPAVKSVPVRIVC
ncbi:FdhF/YdeP family oxidoreductase [Mesorhizobium sp. M7A.F.Ca.CA.001.09.2.1]|uniref:FdhF/YdeP family oxidoreductase n=8 Tax=Mesorhizobium TaxID=68287 RepID=A0AB38T9W9_9HYPH|nr:MULTISPECIES: FdhF/YdeP family oxidoreductase [Mesorhizobium]RUY49601.1 FdhF/YdeP family oxidoreductase [Mesorhizobium sp. M7A.F.Ca.CA.001.13.2.1]RUZ89332.1 FdhF/YdeP family oxidoreductase [Mesorhizobium sp. M7A.F.Ca.US.003.02.2.1]RVA55216.1 FdhF/YdeP family oxidoreductase [Mesorhizobium sp. M7A.F.Ca.US.001.01.1.1]AMX99103.1 formate dehydrogenase [Mesorhizobium ciceri biovar biserrulae]MDF3214234.1 FdhF/YdeP family oxidoreductase [Mesorhizobium ciceri]